MNTYSFNHLFTPDYSHLTGLLKHLNTEELKAILNDDNKTDEIISDLKQIKDIESEREMLLAGNKSIAEFNLSQKSILDATHQNLDSTYKRAAELKELLLAAKNNIEKKSIGQPKDTLLALLQAATSEIDDEAEATVNAFLKNDLSVEDFLEKYLELRKLAHLRRIKAEKLVSIIQKGENNGFTPERPQRLRKPPAPPVPPVPNSSTLPYPNFTSFPSNSAINQNIPVAPSRPAPQPPPAQNYPYPNNAGYPSPFSYLSPYPVPQPGKFPPPHKKG